MRKPDFSLVLATVGRTNELGRLFTSLANQTFTSFELIVVDQNTDDRLLLHIAEAQDLGLSVRHIKHHPPNLAAARNTGIQSAHGTWIGFPDDDCWYDPSLLDYVATRFLRKEMPEGIVARWVEQQEQPDVAARLTWERTCLFRDIPVSSITLFCHQRLFKRIGGFDPRLGIGQWFGAGEETDFVLRALYSDALFIYEPQALVHHAVQVSKTVANPQTRLALRHRARGTGALYAKHRLPLRVIARGLVAPVLRPLMKGALGADLATGCAIVLGRLDGMLEWRKKQ